MCLWSFSLQFRNVLPFPSSIMFLHLPSLVYNPQISLSLNYEARSTVFCFWDQPRLARCVYISTQTSLYINKAVRDIIPTPYCFITSFQNDSGRLGNKGDHSFFCFLLKRYKVIRLFRGTANQLQISLDWPYYPLLYVCKSHLQLYPYCTLKTLFLL